MKSPRQQHAKYDRLVDASGLHCPQPVIRCKAALSLMERGSILQLVTTERDSLREIPTLVRTLGHEMLDTRQVGNRYHFLIESRTPAHKKTVRSLRADVAEQLETLLNDTGLPASASPA